MSKISNSRSNPLNPLNVAGSAAQMHSRDYIEIINVIYKDDHDGCCGKTHSFPNLEEKPIMRKTWDVRKQLKKDVSEIRRSFRASSGKSSQIFKQQQQHDKLSDNYKGVLPDICNKKIETPIRKLNLSQVKSKHHQSEEMKLPSKDKPCSCHEGLIYLRKTHEWQNLLSEYRNEILKLRDALKEKEKATQTRRQFKRSNTQERRDNLNDILREHRLNSYQLIRMRMEERMRHEHRVFEKLTHRTAHLNMHSTNDSDTNPRTVDCSSTQSCSSSSASPVSSAEEYTNEWKDSFIKKDSTTKKNYYQQARSKYEIPNNFGSPYASKLPKRKIQLNTENDTEKCQGDQQTQKTRNTKKPPKVVVRKRVVRCACLNHK